MPEKLYDYADFIKLRLVINLYCSRQRTIMYSVEVQNGLYDTKAVRKFLGKYTEELPETEEQDAREEQQIIIAVATDNVPEGALIAEDLDGTVKVFNAEGQVVGNMAKEAAEALAANVSEIKIEQ